MTATQVATASKALSILRRANETLGYTLDRQQDDTEASLVKIFEACGRSLYDSTPPLSPQCSVFDNDRSTVDPRCSNAPIRLQEGDIEIAYQAFLDLHANEWLRPEPDEERNQRAQLLVSDVTGSPETLGIGELGVSAFSMQSMEQLVQYLGGNTATGLFGLRSECFQGFPSTTSTRISIQWHQVVGVAALATKLFGRTPEGGRVTAMVLADQVGLGKTITLIGFIAFCQLEWARQRDERPTCVPPVISRSFPLKAKLGMLG